MRDYFKLPDFRHFIFGDIFVSSNKNHFFGNSCCGNQAVKRVSMNHWKIFKSENMRSFNRENCKIVFFCTTNKTSGFTIKLHFSQPNFYRKLPNRCHAQVYGIRRVDYNSSCSIGQSLVTGEVPNSCVGIKKIMAHLHIILEIIKRCIEVISHPYLPFQAAISLSFLRLLLCRNLSGGKSQDNRPRWYFARNVNCQPAIGRNFYSLSNAHIRNIA